MKKQLKEQAVIASLENMSEFEISRVLTFIKNMGVPAQKSYAEFKQQALAQIQQALNKPALN